MKNPFRLKPLHMLTYLLVAGLSFLTSCENGIPVPPAIEDNEFEKSDVAIEWYKLQLHIILNANPPISPSIVSRIFAYEGIGLYESARCRIRNSVSLSNSLYQMPAMPSKENNRGYSQSISANATLASLVRSLYPNLTDPNKTSIDSLENAFNEMSKPDMQSEVFKRSQSFGLAIAGAVFNWSKTDNDNQSNVGYVPPVFDGAWVPTPPALASAAAPYLGSARPLLQSDVAGVAPPPAFAYSEAVGSDFYNMVKDIYDVSQALTPEQKNIALFWNDVGVKKRLHSTRPLHFDS